MSEISDNSLRQIVTAAAATVLHDPDQHVEHYWQNRKRESVEPTIGDLAESSGLGWDIISEIVAMTQYAWSWAQSHGPSIADNLIADALVAALTAMLAKWRKPSGKSGLSEEQREPVIKEIARGVTTTLEEKSRLPPVRSSEDKEAD